MNIRDIIASDIEWIENRARKFCKERAQAADLAYETVLKCLEVAERYRPGMPFRPWASVIMTNIYRMLYNRRKCVVFSDYSECEEFADRCRTEERALLRDVLEAVGELDRRSVCIRCVLLYIDGYDYNEIASLTGICVGTVKSRMREGRRMLKEALAAFR